MIQVDNLVKHYGDIKAVDGVSLMCRTAKLQV